MTEKIRNQVNEIDSKINAIVAKGNLSKKDRNEIFELNGEMAPLVREINRLEQEQREVRLFDKVVS